MGVLATTGSPATGVPLGVLIGVLAGVAFLLVLSAATADKMTAATAAKAVSGLFAIPTFCFGGPWLTTTLLSSVELDSIVQSYIIALVIVFMLVVGFPVGRLVYRKGIEIGRAGG